MEKDFKTYLLLPFNSRFLLFLVIGACTLSGCKKIFFNAEKVKATYEDRFPVKDIDPDMDWKMTGQVKVNVSVYEDAGVDYTIRIYDKNPLFSQSTAKLLAEGTANSTTAFTTTMDCPSILDSVFVCRIDAHQRNVVKYVSINNGQINATFGTPVTKTRAAATRTISVLTDTPTRTEAEILALLSSAEEITSSTDYLNGKVYKISKGNTYNGDINKGGLNYDNPATIIIEGTWNPSNGASVERGFSFYVVDGGSIVVPDGMTLVLKESTNFTVYAGGTIQGNKMELTNASLNFKNYNAGTIDLAQFYISTNSGDTYLYNCGEMTIDDMQFTNGYKLVNQGKVTLSEMHYNTVIDNGCYLKGENFIGTLNMGDNSAAEFENLGAYNTAINMGDNSMITVTNQANLAGVKFTGPSSQYALVKINKIADIGNFSSSGNLYYEVQEISDAITSDIWWQSTFLTAIANSEGSISKWGESPIVIPAGDCTGSGNTPTDTGSETPTDPISYTYVFEDNFPLVGDYDFNDVVVDVQTTYLRDETTNYIKRIQLNVTLAAAGATKAVGVGLRIVGIKKSDISAITTGGSDSRFQQSFNDDYSKFNYNSGTYMENNESDVVIPIAGEVHNVFGTSLENMVNTGDGITSKTYTYEIIIELADQTKTDPLFSKDNLDFFICYQYKTMQKRMEVHLYEFWSYGATAAGTIQQENLDLAGNNTWAICVPYGFRYPKEKVNISRTDNPDACAYPYFIYWAKDRTTYTNWYENPVESNVYR